MVRRQGCTLFSSVSLRFLYVGVGYAEPNLGRCPLSRQRASSSGTSLSAGVHQTLRFFPVRKACLLSIPGIHVLVTDTSLAFAVATLENHRRQ